MGVQMGVHVGAKRRLAGSTGCVLLIGLGWIAEPYVLGRVMAAGGEADAPPFTCRLQAVVGALSEGRVNVCPCEGQGAAVAGATRAAWLYSIVQ